MTALQARRAALRAQIKTEQDAVPVGSMVALSGGGCGTLTKHLPTGWSQARLSGGRIVAAPTSTLIRRES